MEYNLKDLVGYFGWFLGGVILLRNGGKAILDIVKAVKSPNVEQDKRIAALEEHVKKNDGYLAQDKKRLDAIEDGNRVTQRAILALLDHSLDGNNTKQMQDAKTDLQDYLLKR